MGGREEICLSPPFVSFITPTLEILLAAAENHYSIRKKAAFYERKQLPSILMKDYDEVIAMRDACLFRWSVNINHCDTKCY